MAKTPKPSTKKSAPDIGLAISPALAAAIVRLSIRRR